MRRLLNYSTGNDYLQFLINEYGIEQGKMYAEEYIIEDCTGFDLRKCPEEQEFCNELYIALEELNQSMNQ